MKKKTSNKPIIILARIIGGIGKNLSHFGVFLMKLASKLYDVEIARLKSKKEKIIEETIREHIYNNRRVTESDNT